MDSQTIQPRELHTLIAQGLPVDLIDVRTPVEFREIHAEPARNVPLDVLNPTSLLESRVGRDHPLYVICRSGSRGQKALEKLQRAGYTNVINVDGGTLAWEEAGLPVNRGKKAMSIERQVRIAAGALVVLGAGLSFVNPYFVLLSGAVGAGLIFAGVTDSCAMGMLLARMPWNQLPACPAAGETAGEPAEAAACEQVPAAGDTRDAGGETPGGGRDAA